MGIADWIILAWPPFAFLVMLTWAFWPTGETLRWLRYVLGGSHGQ